jgi:hypothetical protein
VLQGWIANHVGVRTVTVVGAVVLLVSLAAIAALRPGFFAVLGDPARATTATTVVPTPEVP